MTQSRKPPEAIDPLLFRFHLKTLRPLLEKWFKNKQVPQSILLCGTSGIGKNDVARELAKWFLCEKISLTQDLQDGFGFADTASEFTPHPCGNCSVCHQIQNDQALDFTSIGSADLSQSIKILDLRSVLETQGRSAHGGKFRVFLLPNAERMTIQAANSILKILEEPPRDWIFILTTTDPSLLLPTIVSRCHQCRLRPLPNDELKKMVDSPSLDHKKLQFALKLSGGSLTRLKVFLSESQFQHIELIERFFESPLKYYSELVDWASSGGPQALLLVDGLEAFTHELLSETAKNHPIDNPALKSHAKYAFRQLGSQGAVVEFWMNQTERLNQARLELTKPINRKLLIQDLVASWI